jgi:hypothetical protein
MERTEVAIEISDTEGEEIEAVSRLLERLVHRRFVTLESMKLCFRPTTMVWLPPVSSSIGAGGCDSVRRFCTFSKSTIKSISLLVFAP